MTNAWVLGVEATHQVLLVEMAWIVVGEGTCSPHLSASAGLDHDDAAMLEPSRECYARWLAIRDGEREVIAQQLLCPFDAAAAAMAMAAVRGCASVLAR